MNALHSLVPSWLHRKDDDMPDEMPPLPNVAKLPERPHDLSEVNLSVPEFSEADQDKMIFGRAAVMLEQLKRDREDALRREQELQVQLAEAVLSHQSEGKKVIFLELENVSLRNDIQTLQSDVERYREFMSKVKGILDLFGVKAPEKKPRKAKSKVTIEAVKPETDK